MTTEKKIDYCKLTDSSDPLLPNVEKTYLNSFPEEERRDISLFKELLDNESTFNVYALLNDKQYVGFITEWLFDGFAYVEHFAMDEAARNGGFGRIAMKQFIEQTLTPIILEVELPTDELSTRRIGFYERLGFILDEHEYKQPPYKKGDQWLPMRLMSYGPIKLEESFDKVKNALYQYVYKVEI